MVGFTVSTQWQMVIKDLELTRALRADEAEHWRWERVIQFISPEVEQSVEDWGAGHGIERGTRGPEIFNIRVCDGAGM